MGAAKCFDSGQECVDNKNMTELMPAATEKKVQLQLQLQASDALKVLMGELLKPELRRNFTRSAIYLALYSNPPITLNGGDDLQKYTDGIEDVKTKVHLYTRSLHLAPDIGSLTHEDPAYGVNLRFKLALTAIEGSALFSGPFRDVDPNRAYLLANLPGKILDDNSESRPVVLEYMRRKFTTVPGDNGVQRRAPDLYYVNRPMVKKRVIEAEPEQ
jgi:hypothetical protein